MEEINEFINEHLELFKGFSDGLHKTPNPHNLKAVGLMIDNHVRVIDLMITTLKELKELLNQKTII